MWNEGAKKDARKRVSELNARDSHNINLHSNLPKYTKKIQSIILYILTITNQFTNLTMYNIHTQTYSHVFSILDIYQDRIGRSNYSWFFGYRMEEPGKRTL